MNVEHVDQILKYALASAAQADAPWDRQLGPIHLIKYVYLADLAFSERNAGRSFTGTPWRFYHYGPWSPEVYARILAVVAGLPIAEHTFASRYEKDAVRWSIPYDGDADRVRNEADRELPVLVSSAVMSAVRKFGPDTTELLHHVYTTPPMLRAAPGDLLEFNAPPASPASGAAVPTGGPGPTAKQQKREKELLQTLSANTRAKLAERRAKRARRPARVEPRYDAVFEEGQKWLDGLEGEPLDEGSFEVEISDAVWKDPWRSEPDAS